MILDLKKKYKVLILQQKLVILFLAAVDHVAILWQKVVKFIENSRFKKCDCDKMWLLNIFYIKTLCLSK